VITRTSITLASSAVAPGPGTITQIVSSGASKSKKKAKKAAVAKKKKKKAKAVVYCKTKKVVTAPGIYQMKCRLGKKALRALKKKPLTLTVRTTFTPVTGQPSVTTKTVKLKRKKTKKKKR
jgi:hypothetical protein